MRQSLNQGPKHWEPPRAPSSFPLCAQGFHSGLMRPKACGHAFAWPPLTALAHSPDWLLCDFSNRPSLLLPQGLSLYSDQCPRGGSRGSLLRFLQALYKCHFSKTPSLSPHQKRQPFPLTTRLISPTLLDSLPSACSWPPETR